LILAEDLGDGFVCLWDLRKPEGGPIVKFQAGDFVVSLDNDCQNLFCATQKNGLQRHSVTDFKASGFSYKPARNQHILDFDIRANKVAVSWNDSHIELLQTGDFETK
jgi:hypothetical protein